ncbi:hypothetical protein GCM10023085_08780 [Actinomadura viridis]|uniref:DUF4132 domain-containing protein n=1 Tax=Actinomadura viridis TaxID=58110 RepID=A0A931DIN2_9ACTN|nr:DUF4132 domain-containing protein [Actinomadura viridis]MBG6091889.1 hypothetical protein [Actinomadura viridis]
MDEETLIIPPSWRRRLHPRRGGTPGPAIKPAPSAGPALRARIEAQAAEIDELLDHPRSDPGLVAATRRHLRGEDDPLGAAVAGQIVTRQESIQSDHLTALVDAWCTEHGVAFAAAAVAALSKAEPTWRWIERGEATEAWVRLRNPKEKYGHWWSTRGAARRMRAVLAAADGTEYDRAVARLEDYRDDPLLRLVTAYLVPTRQDWVNECLDEIDNGLRHSRDWMLWCSVRSAEQLVPLGPLGWMAGQADLVTTAVDGAGAALAPVLAEAYDSATRADARRHTAESLAILPTDEAFQALLDRAGKERVQPALLAAMKRFPARAARLLPPAASGTGKAAALAAELLSDHLLAHPELAPEPPATARVPEASAAELPASLADPPWTRKRPAREPVVIDGLLPFTDPAVRWKRGERKLWSSTYHRKEDWAQWLADYEKGLLQPWQETILFLNGPKERVRPLFGAWSPHSLWSVERHALELAARFELDAVPILLHAAAKRAAGAGEALVPFLTPQVASMMADWAVRLKSARPIASDWFARHRVAAAPLFVPAALGRARAPRHAAELALLRIAERDGAEPVIEVARAYGDRAAAAIADLMTKDPSEVMPVRAPKIGDWADPALLPRVLLNGRDRALPPSAVRHLLMLLALPDGIPRGAAEEIRATCDAESLAEFSWAVFERWQAAGSPARDGWALTQLGPFGGDDAARRLAPLIRAWPGQSRHKNASAGLDVLAEIGTDVALTHLHGIAQKLKFKGLREQAREKIDQIAEELGLSEDELADRLVPDFGLDPGGGLVLDYGPRRFTVGFDERLKPYVLDGNGKPRKTLPKPGAKDDPELAPAAYKRFAALKKDVRTVAAVQIRRLETAMIARRRWDLPDFQRYLMSHPLMGHIVRRLVWLTDDGTTFRVAEDATFAGPADDTLTLPPAASVRVAHRLDLDDSIAAWSEVFADYEIAQPFPQLGRPVHALTLDELRTGGLERFEGVTVPLGRLLNLERHGWEHNAPADAGIVDNLIRSLPRGANAMIVFAPGVPIGHREPTEQVTLTSVCVLGGPLDPITASELLAELTDLSTP